jgi:hypothetical protein
MSLFELNIDYLFNDSIFGYLFIFSIFSLIILNNNKIKIKKLSAIKIAGIIYVIVLEIIFIILFIISFISMNLTNVNNNEFNNIYEIKKLINIKKQNKIKEKDFIEFNKIFKSINNKSIIKQNIKIINYFSNDEIKKIDKIICNISEDNIIYHIEYYYLFNNIQQIFNKYKIEIKNKELKINKNETLNKFNQLKNCKEFK